TDLEAFLHEQTQTWREDSSNRDLSFLRNKVRHHVVPLLKEHFGSAAVENLSELAEIARAEEEHWQADHAEIHSYDPVCPEKLPAISILRVHPAAQRRLIREWLNANARDVSISFRLIEELRDLALGLSGKRVELPTGLFVRRTQTGLQLERPLD